jgi:hypothetical protein
VPFLQGVCPLLLPLVLVLLLLLRLLNVTEHQVLMQNHVYQHLHTA